jgi:hypothetical protein
VLTSKRDSRESRVWAGSFVEPAQPRRQQGTASAARSEPSSPGCTIKGNVSSKGERIYHVPSGRDYARTQISPAKGERWFCSEADAQAAGWRGVRK